MATFSSPEMGPGPCSPAADPNSSHIQEPSTKAKALDHMEAPKPTVPPDFRFPVCCFRGCPQYRDEAFKGLSRKEKTETMPFSSQYAYMKHMDEEHKFLPFPCNIPGCSRAGGRGYVVRMNLLKHHQKVHPNVPVPQHLEHLQSHNGPQLPGAIGMKEDVPFTDSGYRSMPNPDTSPNGQPDLDKTQHSLSTTDSSLPKSSRDDNDAKTIYSLETTVDLSYARKLIFELCKDIYYKLHRFVDIRNRSMLPRVLPELIKAFAIRLCYDNPAQVNRNIMFFVYKRHQ
jgi:hypothetical protein